MFVALGRGFLRGRGLEDRERKRERGRVRGDRVESALALRFYSVMQKPRPYLLPHPKPPK